jgi:hypothetical protein
MQILECLRVRTVTWKVMPLTARQRVTKANVSRDVMQATNWFFKISDFAVSIKWNRSVVPSESFVVEISEAKRWQLKWRNYFHFELNFFSRRASSCKTSGQKRNLLVKSLSNGLPTVWPRCDVADNDGVIDRRHTDVTRHTSGIRQHKHFSHNFIAGRTGKSSFRKFSLSNVRLVLRF